MKNTYLYIISAMLGILLLLTSCAAEERRKQVVDASDTLHYYRNPILDSGAEPYAVFHDGYYYYTQGCEDQVCLWKTPDLSRLREAECKMVYQPSPPHGRQHLWAPEIHYIDGKWYIYYTADNGNSDNHRLYVAVSSSPDPMAGDFRYAARLSNDWAIHPTTFSVRGRRYLLWSGWLYQRATDETQGIYIAAMDSPTSVSSERILISTPQYVWERQWVSPDGSRLAYPVYVNENPQAFVTDSKVYVYYGASGSWTPYYCVGRLEADVNSDLLDPASWHKHPEPVFMMSERDSVYSVGGMCLVSGAGTDNTWMLYHARSLSNDEPGTRDSRTPRLQQIFLDKQGVPQLGHPFRLDTLLRRPQ